ncbi:AP-4 complex subunit mu-1 [Perkinsus olseni]|uniref:AP-4 complex subunit mu-1 n=1 Tax=Perkinsus olseni TaxID=32597 RepID=A0A7J6MGK3_PEROL|nr:AP-4 complex subunit mu-1 [Perkinsus olseni]
MTPATVLDSVSQFYILSPRGDTIITRDFRGDIVKGTAEIFFRKAKFWNGGEPPPIFNLDGISFIYVKRSGLYFVLTTQCNVSPMWAIELLNNMIKVIKDYCGVLNEESLRKNFVLVYEILDEMIDFGIPQTTNTEVLRSCVHNEAIMVSDSPGTATGGGILSSLPTFNTSRTMPSTAVHRPIGPVAQHVPQAPPQVPVSAANSTIAAAQSVASSVLSTATSAVSSMAAGHIPGKAAAGDQKNEIFVDILERLTVLMNAQGQVLNSSIDGSIQMKSYLTGNPELRLALNDDLEILSQPREAAPMPNYGGGPQQAVVPLDDCTFHPRVDLNDFDSQRILSFVPPDGEFSVMNYRIDSEFRPPFRVTPFVDSVSQYKVELVIKIRAEVPESNYGGNIQMTIPTPLGTASVNCDMSAVGGAFVGAGPRGMQKPPPVQQSADFVESERKLYWNIKKLQGGHECTLRARLNFAQPVTGKPRIGPLALTFEVPMYVVSGLQVKYLRIADRYQGMPYGSTQAPQGAQGNPYRWVRYVTQSQSYMIRMD